jgi:hypothetical protein
MQHGPRPSIGKQDGREEHGVEIDVILSHELVELNVLRIEPPLFPIFRVASRNRRIADRSIKLLELSIGLMVCELVSLPKHLLEVLSD